MLQKPCDRRGHCHYKGHCHTHAESRIDVFRNAYERTDAEKLGEYDVVDQYCAEYYCDIGEHMFIFLLLDG